jgi:hypothetical protein
MGIKCLTLTFQQYSNYIMVFTWLYVSVGILLTMEGTCMAERRFGLTKDRQFLLKGL